MQRLRELEGIVTKLESTRRDEGDSRTSPRSNETNLTTAATPNEQNEPFHALTSHSNNMPESGKLMVQDGKVTYVTAGFWVNLTNELADLLEDINGDSDDYDSDGFTDENYRIQMGNQNFIVGFTSDAMTLKLLHPNSAQIKSLWGSFMQNVKPVLKAFYVPIAGQVVLKACNSTSSLTDIEEAWMFGMYYIVFMSLNPNDCLRNYGLDKQTALERFRWASEQALARAGFLLAQDLQLLEAFLLYVITLTRHVDNGSVRTMVSLLVNVAQSMGLHRDGEQFGVPPFETEMRRRVWWSIRTIGSSIYNIFPHMIHANTFNRPSSQP
jgi:hypothetical protein